MIRISQRVRKFFEKIVSSQTIVAKRHKKSMKVKLDVEDRKFVSTLKLVISKKLSKNIIKDKVFAVFLIEVSSDNEKKKNKEKNAKNDKKKKNEKKQSVKRINVCFIIKRLLNQKDYSIINFKKRVNDVKKDYINVSNTQNFEKNETISSASKKVVFKILTLITKTYILV